MDTKKIKVNYWKKEKKIFETYPNGRFCDAMQPTLKQYFEAMYHPQYLKMYTILSFGYLTYTETYSEVHIASVGAKMLCQKQQSN